MKFTITIPPKAQKRAKSRGFIIKGGGKKGQDIARAQTYTDEDQRTEQNRLMALMYEFRPPEPLQGPLLLGVKAYLPIPKSKPKKWQAAALAGEIRPTSRPDTDNLIKQIKDCANRAMWGDDCQVVEYLPGTGKYYDDGGGTRWEIEIITLDEYRAGRSPVHPELIPQITGEARLF
jgi:Holliday junction resolvase RusA-like endonuclease